MARVMHDEPRFADFFLKFMLARSMRIQADLVDQLFNSSEKRLARIFLLMAEFGKPGERETFIPPISQETLAEMIGTTRSRVSFFMNRFRTLGYINYNGRIQVNKSLLNVVLLDQLPEHNAHKPLLPIKSGMDASFARVDLEDAQLLFRRSKTICRPPLRNFPRSSACAISRTTTWSRNRCHPRSPPTRPTSSSRP